MRGTAMASVAGALFVSLAVAGPSPAVHEALGAAVAPPIIGFVLRPGEEKCAKRVFDDVGGTTMMVYRERQVQVPADLWYRTVRVEGRATFGIAISNITVTYCISARRDARSALHQVRVVYSFYGNTFAQEPYATREVSVEVRVEKP